MIFRHFSLALTLFVLGTAALAEKVELGKLGQATVATRIHASPSSRSRVYYRVKPFEYLVVRESARGGWTRVLLQNGALGYVRTENVAMLPYTVTADAPPATAVRASGRQALALSSRGGSALQRYTLQFQGTPYKWGGNDLVGGIDCSGFVKEIFSALDVNLPRTAAEQATVGKPITRLENLKQGDRLYFWDSKRGKVGHTGIYLGDGFFVHSSSTRGGVATDNLRNPKWMRILVAARR